MDIKGRGRKEGWRGLKKDEVEKTQKKWWCCGRRGGGGGVRFCNPGIVVVKHLHGNRHKGLWFPIDG